MQADREAYPRDRWYLLGVLTLVYALNIADRYSITTLLEPIRLEMHLSDSGVGFLTGVAVALFYLTVGIPIASLADRSNRRNILVVALLLWSGMTALCGMARNYWQLLLARFGVGIGEGGGTPTSTSMIADLFPAARRPLALSVFSLGACIGAWLGSSVAGDIAQRYGWRAAFLALGIPGIVLALIILFTVREPVRGVLDRARSNERPSSVRATIGFIWRQKAALHLLAAGAVITLWSWGLMWWTPAFLARSHHMSVGSAGGLLGPMHLIGGAAGTLIAAWIMGTRLGGDSRRVTQFLAVVTAAATIPSVLVYWVSATSTMTVLLWLFVPAVYFFVGPIFGLMQNVVPPNMRATACALLMFAANFANLVIAPQVVGWLSDWFAASFGAGDESLRYALLVIAPTGLWAAFHLWRCREYIDADEQRAMGDGVVSSLVGADS